MKEKIRNLLVLFTLIFMCGCSRTVNPKSKTYYTYFDTVCTITSYDRESSKHFEENCLKIEELLSYLNASLDIYHSYSGLNNLHDLNENAGNFVRLDEQTVSFLKFCLDACSLTQGYTDIKMGKVLELWHEGRTETNTVPSEEALKEASLHRADLEFDGLKVRITDPLSSIDCGAIAKGWVADRVADLLLSLGCKCYVINIGGNIKCLGSCTVGIRDPRSDGALAAKIELDGSSCVTSGDYERYFEVNGKRYCHIINPQTLYPPDYWRSVSVICRESAAADALSTALFCMDLENGLKLVESLTDIRVVWIDGDGTLFDSANLQLR